MKTVSTYLVLALSTVLPALAEPVAHHGLTERASGFQSVDLSFQAGPVSYNLTIPADGKEYFTGKPLISSCLAFEKKKKKKFAGSIRLDIRSEQP